MYVNKKSKLYIGKKTYGNVPKVVAFEKAFAPYFKNLRITAKEVIICSSCMEVEGSYKNSMCKECYDEMIKTNQPITNEELDNLLKEFE